MTLVAEPPVPLETPPAPSEGERLAQWLRAGCQGTKQAFGLTFAGANAACAIGALYWGVKGRAAEPHFVIQDLGDATGIDFFRLVSPPGRGHPMHLYRLIITLNDEYRWSREAIAAWLERNV